ncbi:MAG: hypothetical protein BZY88_09855 [SAR202 cluster bacterium Io17-Chloro-G9]|nr:MAG: hypothetical protein BZY88_09855 [SAR202 cluster bacterium Io17-Chloro-G9]
MERCQRCSGAGNEPGTAINNCATCRGNGQVRRAQRSIFGQFAQIIACTTCRGTGKVIEKPCNICRGAGQEKRERKISVKIPAGVEDTMQVRLAGEGDIGAGGGPAGNLYVHLSVKNHQFFRRDGNDLVYILPINVAEAALGVEKHVPTLDGKDENLKVPQGTQPGTEFRIKGKGVPHLKINGRGDLRVLIDLKVPDRLNAEQRALLEQFALSISANGDSEKAAAESGQTGDVGYDGPADGSGDDSGGPKDETAANSETAREDEDKGIFDRIKDSLG